MSQNWKSTYWGTFSYREKGLHSSWAHSAPGQCLTWISSPCSALATTRRELLDIILLDRATDVVDVIGGVLGMVKSQFSTSVFSSAFPRSPFPIYYADGSVREPHSNIHQLRTKMPHRSNWALAKPATHSWQWWGSVGNISTCKYQRNSKLRHAVSVYIHI